MRGRKPKNVSLKLLTGDPGKRRVSNPDEHDPFVQSEVVQPSDLSDLEAGEWRRLAEALAPVLNRTSEGLLRAAVSAYGQFVEADRVIREKGMFYETCGEAGTVIRQHPAMKARDVARAAYVRTLGELGAGPVASTRVRRLPAKQTPKEKAMGTARFFT